MRTFQERLCHDDSKSYSYLITSQPNGRLRWSLKRLAPWFRTEELGETIEFGQDKRSDGSMAEGTFSFAKNDEILCLNRCPDISISVDGQTFRTPFRTDSNFTDWANCEPEGLAQEWTFLGPRQVGSCCVGLDLVSVPLMCLISRASTRGLSTLRQHERCPCGQWPDRRFILERRIFFGEIRQCVNRWNCIESPTWTSNAKFGSSVIRFDNDYSLDNASWRDSSLSDAVPNVSFRAERFLGTKQF